MKDKLFYLPCGKNGVFDTSGYKEYKIVSLSQVVNEAISFSRNNAKLNKPHWREGLVFKLVKDFKDWDKLVGNCKPLKPKQIEGVKIEGMIYDALEDREVTDPCIAVFRVDGKSYVYCEGGHPKIFNGILYFEKGGNYYREEDEDGNIINWAIENNDADRTKEGEYLLTRDIPFPNDMSEEWRQNVIKRYGKICDRYHIVPTQKGW